MIKSSLPKVSAPVQLTWSHLGILYRVTAWPDVEFQAQVSGKWAGFNPDPSSEIFAAAAVMIGRKEWEKYLEFVPAPQRRILERFRYQRLAALAVMTLCPELLDALEEAPALVAFVASHAELRGSGHPLWNEISAIQERGGIFGVLEWLGLPSAPRTMQALAELQDPDLPKRLLTRVREALWNPLSAEMLHHAAPRNDRELLLRCQALAA